jgi:hypothetical protein
VLCTQYLRWMPFFNGMATIDERKLNSQAIAVLFIGDI